jgi:GNAT superfamily N-acetyltransferase
MTVRLAKIAEVRTRIEPLLRAHWEEIAHHRSIAPLNPCWEYYYANERMNRLVVVVAENGHDLVGYSVYFLAPMLHNMPKMLAQNDIIYIRPEYRRGALAVRLMQMGEAEAKRLGASIVSMHVKVDHDFSRLLVRAGYAEVETMYSKELI